MITKIVMIHQPEAQREARYNVQIWISVDGGKNFHYSGNGKFFESFEESQAYIKKHQNV